MTHYKLDSYIALCTHTSFNKKIYTKDIKQVDCTECKKIYAYFKNDIQKIWGYARIDLQNRGII